MAHICHRHLACSVGGSQSPMRKTESTPSNVLALESAVPEIDVAGRPRQRLAVASLAVPLFAITLFLSAFLLFLVEPMIAKMVLPVLGGAPMVWNTCVVFFQLMLLAGYAYAHAAARWLNVRWHTAVHALLLAVAVGTLPFALRADAALPAGGHPVPWLLMLLATTIGLPFFALSTNASVLQHWLSRTDHPAGRDPYFLYAASNLGSLLALAAYPTIVEPLLSVRAQTRLWAIGYTEFVALIVACAIVVWRSPDASAPRGAAIVADREDQSIARPAAGRRAMWVALAFVPSSLMLAVTNYLSTDIAAVPLLWIIPLALYLLTFVVAFGGAGQSVRRIARPAMFVLVVPVAIFLVANVRNPLVFIIPLHLVAFAMIALSCHADLAVDRPAPAQLTEFYLWISVGGVLGGLFNTLIAPLLFSSIVEYPLVLVVACALAWRAGAGGWRGWTTPALVAVAVFASTWGLAGWLHGRGAAPGVVFIALALPAIAVFAQRRRPLRFAACLAAMLIAGSLAPQGGERVLYAERTFFGVYRVSIDKTSRFYALAHGTTLHGIEAIDPSRPHEALTYFHRTGPAGQAFDALPAAAAPEIAVIGLGIGTLASYAQPGQRWTVYEIDPAVERIARESGFFTFLGKCGTQCGVVIGDARLSLAAAKEHQYGVIVLDAFSSDAIPIHLITSEAVSLYLSRLAPGGVLLVHISNRHLNLGPILARLAERHALVALENHDVQTAGWPEAKSESRWIVMARRRADLGRLDGDPRWTTPAATAATPLWTDDFSNILSVISLR
jgi:hypothetical protein